MWTDIRCIVHDSHTIPSDSWFCQCSFRPTSDKANRSLIHVNNIKETVMTEKIAVGRLMSVAYMCTGAYKQALGTLKMVDPSLTLKEGSKVKFDIIRRFAGYVFL